jgi:hypothetical protein
MEWRRRILSSTSFLQSLKRRHRWARRQRWGGAGPLRHFGEQSHGGSFSGSHPVGRPPSSQSPKSVGDANPAWRRGLHSFLEGLKIRHLCLVPTLPSLQDPGECLFSPPIPQRSGRI